jgi:hypothetical protein
MTRIQTQWTTFGALPIGAEFYSGGNRCTKKSSRTAWLHHDGDSMWFYFGKSDRVTSDLPIQA